MRIIVIEFAFILIMMTNNLPAQNFSPVLGDNKKWTLKSENFSGVWTDTLSVENDTIINNVVFKIMNTQNKTYYLNENTDNGKIILFSNTDQSEKLLMDLSLIVGDTFYVDGNWISNPDYYCVDSVFTKNGRKHIRLNLPLTYANNEKLTFIEGIGTNIGLFYNDQPDGYLNPYLLCVWDNNDLNFSNLYYDGECSVLSSMDIDEIKENDLLFYIAPNPVSGNSFELSFITPFTGKLFLYNIYGNLVYTETINNPTSRSRIVIPINVKNTVYILKAIKYNNQIQTKKVTYYE